MQSLLNIYLQDTPYGRKVQKVYQRVIAFLLLVLERESCVVISKVGISKNIEVQ